MKIDGSNFVGELRKKNQKAMDFIVDVYGNLIYKIVYSILYENYYSSSVEECTNDVFMKIWNNIDCFHEEKGSFKSWIIAIAKFKAIDYKRKLIKNSNHADINDYSALSSEENIENILVIKETRNELLSVIGNMKEPDRNIFIKRYFLNENIDSIAESLSLTNAAVENRLSRGRKFLRGSLSF